MYLNQIDKSNYFRAMLLLSGKDKKISTEEREFMDKLGQKLGFEASFRRHAINSLFENDYIGKEPPRFSSPEIARSFIRDGIKLIISDPQLNQHEIDWLANVAKVNGVDENFIYEELNKFRNSVRAREPQLEIENYL